ncbi:MAG: polysaccharide pyruvyl transferase family protein [Pseudomonadota bacterium]
MFGFGNLGDEAIQTSVASNLGRREQSVSLEFVCLSPQDVARKFRVPAHDIFSGESVKAPHSGVANRIDAVENSHNRADVFDPAGVHTLSARQRLIGVARSVPLVRELLAAVWRFREHKRSLLRIHRIVADLDLLLISGSGVLDDTWSGRWRRPRALFLWCRAAADAGVPVVFASIGATSLKTRKGKRFAREALQLADYRSYRDKESITLARSLGVDVTSDAVCPDLAFSMDELVLARARDAASTKTAPRVSIGPIPYSEDRHWHTPDTAKASRYRTSIARLATTLADQGIHVGFALGHAVVDLLAVNKVEEEIGLQSQERRDRIDEHIAISDLQSLMNALAKTDVVVTSRFHGVLLSLMLGKPVVALSYDSKIDNLMAEFDLEDSTFPIGDFDVTDVAKSVRVLLRTQGSLSPQLIERSAAYRQQLDAQFEKILRIARAHSG